MSAPAMISLAEVDEREIRDMLGKKAIDVFGFDRKLMREAADRIGPKISDIQQAVS